MLQVGSKYFNSLGDQFEVRAIENGKVKVRYSVTGHEYLFDQYYLTQDVESFQAKITAKQERHFKKVEQVIVEKDDLNEADQPEEQEIDEEGGGEEQE
jgi:hypothetical protein